MAHVIPIGEPVNEAERSAIARLRDGLPDNYVIIHNFEIEYQKQVFEVDLAVLAPHALYIVDVKGTRGRIDVEGGKWYPDGRAPFASPLAKTRHHSKVVKDLLTKYGDSRGFDMHAVFTDAAVILTAPDAQLVDRTRKDGARTVRLEDAARYFQDVSTLPHWVNTGMLGLYKVAAEALGAVSRKPEASLRFGNWVVEDHLGAGAHFDEYRAHNDLAGSGARTVRLRVYRLDPYADVNERARERSQLMNAYQMLERMPPHPAVVAARDFFETGDSDAFVLVTEDPHGRALTLHLRRPDLPLTFDQKLRLAHDVLSGLAHAHAHGVVHRNVHPGTVLVTPEGGARLMGFEYARVESEARREWTLANAVLEVTERTYLAPECLDDANLATPKSDVFSAGVLLYEVFTGELPWRDSTELFERAGTFTLRPSEVRADLPAWFDAWLQALCALDPGERLGAVDGLARLDGHLRRAQQQDEGTTTLTVMEEGEANLMDLPANYRLSQKYRVLERLGRPGSFGAVYAVLDTFGDVKRAVKLLRTDRAAQLDRLKTEYRTLVNLPEHPRVVRVFDADILPSKVPFLVFEFVDGQDVGALLERGMLAAGDALELGRQAAEGLAHLHAHGVYHCDIKPRNLMWSPDGVKIIDFNVAVRAGAGEEGTGGTRRYLPPDADPQDYSTEALADRDVFALGVTTYEALSGVYPWDPARTPAAGRSPTSLSELSGLRDLAPDFAAVVMRAIQPRRVDRYRDARAFLEALQGVTGPRQLRPDFTPAPIIPELSPETRADLLRPHRPNTNPFVEHLATLYSQSQRSNSGTRGLTEYGTLTYAMTALDRELLPAVQRGEYRLVIVTGNAGDGKTAFLQQLEAFARQQGAAVAPHTNGYRFELEGRSYLANLDGSQDEEDRSNDDVLREFFAPYADEAAPGSATHTRLIAINEGRLMDFLTTHHARFGALRVVVEAGLLTGAPAEGIAVVNLNLRSVVAEVARGDVTESIFDQQVQALTDEPLWAACASCDLRDKCYALHNARTFQDPVNGARVRERLRALYTLVHLRGRLHITLRDLRSALAFTLTSGRDCDDIHALHASGGEALDPYLDGYYFNAWMGGEGGSNDRLLRELRVVDVAAASDPQLDRTLDFDPTNDQRLTRFDARSTYDQDVLARFFSDLPRLVNPARLPERFAAHRRYLAATRRRFFFERRDGAWQDMIPYRAGRRLLELLGADTAALEEAKGEILRALNRGEGLVNPDLMGGQLALQVREVERGAIRSYRVFPKEHITLRAQDTADRARYVEHTPTGLTLEYAHRDHVATLLLNLDTLEMLERLNAGYVPSVEEREGRYLSLVAFKNILASRPYQEVLLAVSDDELYRIARHADGRLEMTALEA